MVLYLLDVGLVASTDSSVGGCGVFRGFGLKGCVSECFVVGGLGCRPGRN